MVAKLTKLSKEAMLETATAHWPNEQFDTNVMALS